MESGTRLEAIDHFRGLAIVLMVLVNGLSGVEQVPGWLKHAPDVGLTIADLVAPLFIFAIGLTYGASVRRRVERDGWPAAAGHFVRRFLALLGIGALISAGETALGFNDREIDWGVLQAIGVAGLLTLPAIRLPATLRAGLGLALLGVYQILLDRYWLEAVLISPHGGLPGALGWTAQLILATTLADLYHDRLRARWVFPWGAALVLALGVALALWVPVSKNRVSASYVLVSLGAGALLFWVFSVLDVRASLRLPLLAAWGRNPLLLYLLHFLLLGLLVLPGVPAWYSGAPLWLAALQMLGIVAALSWAARFLQRRSWRFSL